MQPTPVMPDNACPFNPYVGLDRGLFMTRKTDYPFARVHTAKWTANGPTASPGMLQFTLMGYATLPVTPADFAAGSVLTTSAQEVSFDCLTRGAVFEPILVEYFANSIYFNHYLDGGIKLEDYEVSQVYAIAQKMVAAGAGNSGVLGVQMTVDFPVQPNGAPIARGMILVHYNGVKNGVVVDKTIQLADGVYDPLQVAMDHIKTV